MRMDLATPIGADPKSPDEDPKPSTETKTPESRERPIELPKGDS